MSVAPQSPAPVAKIPFKTQLKEGIIHAFKPFFKFSFYKEFIKEYGVELIVMPIVFASIIWYFVYKFNKVNRALALMVPLEEKLTGLTSLKRCQQIMGESADFRLCDFWIASSYKTYLAHGFREEVHVNIIKQTLKLGCRYIDLDLFTQPTRDKRSIDIIIAHGDPFNKLVQSQTMLFEDTMKEIATFAFNPRLKNNDDPLFINLNMEALRDDGEAMSKVAQTIKRHFGATLLEDKYNFQGRFSSPKANVATMAIKELLARKSTVIMSSTDVSNTDLDILVNLCSSSMANLYYKTFSETLGISLTDLKNMNKNVITVVKPDIELGKPANYNWVQNLTAGCQFMTLYYNTGTSSEELRTYIDFFKTYSFALKPYQMRFKPIRIEPPLEQNPNAGFDPITVNTPLGSFNS